MEPAPVRRPTLVVGIQAAARTPAYLPTSLASFQAAGVPGPVHVFAEPGVLPTAPDYTVWHAAERQYGCFPNWKRALLGLYALETDWLMVCQDDVIWRDDAASVISAALLKFQGDLSVGALSFYTSRKMVPNKDEAVPLSAEGWAPARFHDNAFVGAQTLCFPRWAVTQLLATPRFVNHDSSRKVDVLVGNALVCDLGLKLLVHRPSVCEHIGDISTLGRHKIKGIQWGRRGFSFRKQRYG